MTTPSTTPREVQIQFTELIDSNHESNANATESQPLLARARRYRGRCWSIITHKTMIKLGSLTEGHDNLNFL